MGSNISTGVVFLGKIIALAFGRKPEITPAEPDPGNAGGGSAVLREGGGRD
jgi:hypothetical protein